MPLEGSGRRQRAFELLFVTKAEYPGLLGLNDLTLLGGERWSAAEEGRKLPIRIQIRESLYVNAHLDTVKDFVLASALERCLS